MANSKKITRYRSAKTGEYVTEQYANKNPSTTVKEKDNPPSKKKK